MNTIFTIISYLGEIRMKKIVLLVLNLVVFSFCFGLLHLDISGYSATNASSPLNIESYVADNNEVVHPDVLYFENGWNGYEYWMVFTPFPNSNAQYENPSIAVSHDGLIWEIPPRFNKSNYNTL